MGYIDIDFSFYTNNTNDSYFTLASFSLRYRIERLLRTLVNPAISKEYQGKALIDTPQVKILTDGVNRESVVLSPVIGFIFDKCPDDYSYKYACSNAKAKGAMLLTRVKSAILSKDGTAEDWLYTDIQDDYAFRVSNKSFYFTDWIAQWNTITKTNYFSHIWKILNFFAVNELRVEKDGVIVLKNEDKIFGFDRINTSSEAKSVFFTYIEGDERDEFNKAFKDEATFKSFFQKNNIFKPHPVLGDFEFDYSLTKKGKFYTINFSYNKKFKDLDKLYYIKDKFYELAELGKEVFTPIAFDFWDNNYVRVEYTGGLKESITTIEFLPEEKIVISSYNLLTNKKTQKELDVESEHLSILIKSNKFYICDKLNKDFKPNKVIYELDNLPTLAVISQDNQYMLRHGFRIVASSLEENYIYSPTFDNSSTNLYNLTIDNNSIQKAPVTMTYFIEKDSK